jgi:uncharacterized protein YukJ
MPIGNYGVLKGKVVGSDRGTPNDRTPHFEIHVKAAAKDYRVAVNVQSQQAPSEVLFLENENLSWAQLPKLKSLSAGFTPLTSNNPLAIDYVREPLFDRTQMKSLPANVPGQNNDLEDMVDQYIATATKSAGAMIYAFGARFGPQAGADKSFGFSPELGVHDIHMNQGNSGSFAKDDGVFQDGALLLYLPQGDRWIALFLAFQSQSFQTDDRTGHRAAAQAAAAAGSAGPTHAPALGRRAPKRRHR